jgi:hypothetical protein
MAMCQEVCDKPGDLVAQGQEMPLLFRESSTGGEDDSPEQERACPEDLVGLNAFFQHREVAVILEKIPVGECVSMSIS